MRKIKCSQYIAELESQIAEYGDFEIEIDISADEEDMANAVIALIEEEYEDVDDDMGTDIDAYEQGLADAWMDVGIN